MMETLVCDNGSSAIKLGWSDCQAPNKIVPKNRENIKLDKPNPKFNSHNDIGRGTKHLSKSEFPISDRIITNWDSYEKVWNRCLKRVLFVGDLSDRYVLFAEPPLNSKQQRTAMAELMFEHFGTAGISFVNQGALALYANGRVTGVALDCGAAPTVTDAIYEGYGLDPSLRRKTNHGGEDLTDILLKLMQQERNSYEAFQVSRLDRDVANGIKEQCCFVSTNYEEALRKSSDVIQSKQMYRSTSSRFHKLHERRVTSKYFDCKIPLPDGCNLIISKERFMCPENLFNPSVNDSNFRGIHQMVDESIQSAAMDLRRFLYNNIVLCGGSTLFPGLVERLLDELASLLPNTTEVTLVANPSRQFNVWEGGALISSTSQIENSLISRDDYFEFGDQAVLKTYRHM